MGRYIRTLMAWHDYTQTDLAKILGCSQPALGRKLAGQRRFTADEIVAIAETFEIEPGLLLRPPQLAGVLGAVRKSAGDLLTSTYRRLCRSAGIDLVGERRFTFLRFA